MHVPRVEQKDASADVVMGGVDDFVPHESIHDDKSGLDHGEQDSDACGSDDSSLASEDDEIEQPVTGVGDVEARKKVLQGLLRNQDSLKTLASDGPYHFSSKGLLLGGVYHELWAVHARTVDGLDRASW